MTDQTRRTFLQGAISSSFLLSAMTPSSPFAQSLSTSRGRTRVIEIAEGRLRGLALPGANAFLGIPYAAAATDERRFAPPAPVHPWPAIRDASHRGFPCPQVNRDLPAWVDPGTPSEDCLVLNVWTPSNTIAERLPVMVWIHGGAYDTGSGGLAIYDGAALARTGKVVLVTVNHRLNALGYLDLSSLGDGFADSANLGQRDLVAALKWVRRNITRFGGDANNVTVFGESGGGAKICTLAAMPDATGLFHKMIIQSGSILDIHTPESAARVTKSFLDELGLTPLHAHRLRELPASALSEAASRVALKSGNLLAFRPVVDGRIVSADLGGQPTTRLVRGVPLLIGTTLHEAVYFTDDPVHEPANDEALAEKIRAATLGIQLAPEQARALIAGYRALHSNMNRLDLLIRISTDAGLWRRALIQADAHSRQSGSKVFVYEFAWKTPCFERAWAPHGSEIPLVFGNLDYSFAWDRSDTPAVRAQADPAGHCKQLAHSMMSAWMQFARTGDPNGNGIPHWPSHQPEKRIACVFDSIVWIAMRTREQERELIERIVGAQS